MKPPNFLVTFFQKYFSKNLLHHHSNLVSELRCKGNSYFWNHQIFLGLFFKNYQKNLYCVSPFLKAKAGAKIKHLFEITKYFGNFFQKTFLRTFLALSERFSYLIAGAKVAIKSKFASLLLNIFRNYYIFLIIDMYTYIYIYKGRGR